jgi:hypothetical protein
MRQVNLAGFALAMTCALFGVASAQTGAIKKDTSPGVSAPLRQDISRLLALMKVVETEKSGIDPLFEDYKHSAPQVPAAVWDELKRDIKSEFTDQVIIDTYIPIYAKHFTPTEIKALLRFYESAVGRKYVDEMPKVNTEAFIEGVKRGEKIGARLREKLKAKGYNITIS